MSRGAAWLLALLMAPPLARADALAAPQCLNDMKAQALALFRHHVHDNDEQSIERAALDANSPPRATLRADPRGPGLPQHEVIELGGFYVKTDYDIELTFQPTGGSCTLIGQSIIESVRLGRPRPLPRRSSQCLVQASSDAVGLIKFLAAQQGVPAPSGFEARLQAGTRTMQRRNPKTLPATDVEVIEMSTEALGAEYRIKLTYVPLRADCALMGREILELR